MPIVWRYVTKTYLKIYLLSFSALLGMGFLVQHGKLAALIAAGASFKQSLILFLCFSVAALTFSIAISAGIASCLTVYKFRSSFELTSFKTSSLPFWKIFLPLPFIALFLMLINLFLVAEGIPYTRLITNKLHLKSQNINPLVLLKKNRLNLLQDVHLEMDLSPNGASAKNCSAFYYIKNENRIALITADHLQFTGGFLRGNNVSWISYYPSHTTDFDHLLIDHQLEIHSPESAFFSLLERPAWVPLRVVLSLYALRNLPFDEISGELRNRLFQIVYPLLFSLVGMSCGLMRRPL